METALTTFLAVCETMNYRKTAELLHLTQPAITKQIQSLEQQYGAKLFLYANRRLSITPQGEALREYALSVRRNEALLYERLNYKKGSALKLGATKTIGDYVIAPAVAAYLRDGSRSMEVVMDNTRVLLHLLERNALDFALIEGVVDKKRYSTISLWDEPYIGICSKNHPLAGRTVSLSELEKETLLIREKGSGTRALLEAELERVGYTSDYFARAVSISNFGLLRRLVADGIGISFTYRAVIAGDDNFASFNVKGFSEKHEFNVVYLIGTELKPDAAEFLRYLREAHGSQ